MQDSLDSTQKNMQHDNAADTKQSSARSAECGCSDVFSGVRFRCSPSGFLLILIYFYRKVISPLFPPCCRFTPTCSAYAVEAIVRFGAWKGFALTLWRILRCNPFCKGGYDPVPQKKATT